ncbi:Bowman-Birk type proteinase inhibitor [Spatholobus suberectus]|nr:Bowman-Birk type proteinase inhibitor [Spatholobus suberectus]
MLATSPHKRTREDTSSAQRERERDELKKVTLVKAGLLLFLMGFTATTVDARFDPSSFITQLLTEGDFDHYVKSTTTACCDECYCTRSIPPQCHCADVGTSCHSACKSCLCKRSHPPQCSCEDNTTFCYDKCDSSEAKAH